MNPTRARNLRWIGIEVGERHWDYGSGVVAALALGIEAIDFVDIARRPVDLEVLLVVRYEGALWADEVACDQSIPAT